MKPDDTVRRYLHDMQLNVILPLTLRSTVTTDALMGNILTAKCPYRNMQGILRTEKLAFVLRFQ